MADDTKQGVPPPRPKTISREEVPRGGRASLGRDPYVSNYGNYSKAPPPRELDEYDEI